MGTRTVVSCDNCGREIPIYVSRTGIFVGNSQYDLCIFCLEDACNGLDKKSKMGMCIEDAIKINKERIERNS
jgi:ssDNA-binding Zn-finger/Zn-ribbon topoisomerase 1